MFFWRLSSLRYPSKEPSNTQSDDTPAGSGSGTSGGEEGAARMFALVVSLAHVHNISVPGGSAIVGRGGGASASAEGQSSSQLHVELGPGGHQAIVTARRK